MFWYVLPNGNKEKSLCEIFFLSWLEMEEFNDYYHYAHGVIQEHTQEAKDDTILVNNGERKEEMENVITLKAAQWFVLLWWQHPSPCLPRCIVCFVKKKKEAPS